MKKREDAKICDAILDKFRGNESFDWERIHSEDFYKSIDDDYYVVENILNFLLGQGVNELETYQENGKEYIRLSRKGFYTISDLRSEGHFAEWRDRRLAKNWKITVGVITIITFLLVGFRFFKDFIDMKPKSFSTSPLGHSTGKIKDIPVPPQFIDTSKMQKRGK